eukprot:scpid32335/ scgid26987/ GRB2-associated-binding protein 2; GRB2-associated binder 2; Growth factor receptor bound protein 2-associated protein 2; PH domain-containing adaptor molecule p97
MAQEMVKTGYLTKSPPQSTTSISFKNWRRRWFVLLDSSKAFPLAPRQVRLEYYTDETSASHCEKPKGVIDLRDCSGVVASAKEIRGHKNVFNVVTKRRCYHLSADTVADKEKWVFELQRIVNDCKKPTQYGMTTGQFASSVTRDDTVLAIPKLIPPAAPAKKMKRTRSDEPTLRAGSPSKGSSANPSLTYDEDWDSDEGETAGPMSVQSMSSLSSDDGFVSPRSGGGTPSHTFGRDQSPIFSASLSEPVRFGTGEYGGDVDDGIPDYKNIEDGTDDGIHDYYDYEHGGAQPDETEDGIADYDDTDEMLLDETEDGILEYSNLDEAGQHMKDTDDGIFDYADVAFPISQQAPGKNHASMPHPAPKGAYVNIEDLVGSATAGASIRSHGSASASIRSHGSASAARSRPGSFGEADSDPLLLVQMPGTVASFGQAPSNGFNGSYGERGLYKTNSAGYINLPPNPSSSRPSSMQRPASVEVSASAGRPPAVPRKMGSSIKSSSSSHLPQPSSGSFSAGNGAHSQRPPPKSARPKPNPAAKPQATPKPPQPASKPVVRPRPHN